MPDRVGYAHNERRQTQGTGRVPLWAAVVAAAPRAGRVPATPRYATALSHCHSPKRLHPARTQDLASTSLATGRSRGGLGRPGQVVQECDECAGAE
jgi:hypothetical protein